MHPIRKQRLIFVLFVVVLASISAALFGVGLRKNIDLFYMPHRIVVEKPPINKQMRAGGCVQPNSLVREPNSLTKRFVITDGLSELPVVTDEILPDLFGEGESTVLTGMLNEDGVFVATQVLAKHDESYMPPEVMDGLEQASENVKSCENLEYDS